MLVEAIYEDGKILFSQKLNFAHNRFAIKVDVPENEIVKSVESVGISDSLSAEMAVTNSPRETESLPTEYLEFVKLRESVLGKDYVYIQEKTDRELMQEHWMEKYA